jgi:malonyl-CoA O-methyltransferase
METKLQYRFNKSARDYDRLTALHRQIADGLMRGLPAKRAPASILDVGCGTGYLTGVLKDRFARAHVAGLDFSASMLEIARNKRQGIEWILGDSQRLPFADGGFDWVVSNAAYQWSPDLREAFQEARRVLVPGGILACTLFGFHTCQELFRALYEAKPGGLEFNRLVDETQVRQALRANEFHPQIYDEFLKVDFASMRALMDWLKALGINSLAQEGFIGPRTLARAEAIYRQKFSSAQGVAATIEVIHVYAQK